MSQILTQWAMKKTGFSGLVKVGQNDPYYDASAQKRRWWQRKHMKPLPQGLLAHDAKVLKKVRLRAYHLDLLILLCGARIGWLGIIGLLPWIGDAILTWLALGVVRKAQQIEGGLPHWVVVKMMANVTFDFCVGLVPLAGDVIAIVYKCNLRNYVLLEQFLRHKYGDGVDVEGGGLAKDTLSKANRKSENKSDSKPDRKSEHKSGHKSNRKSDRAPESRSSRAVEHKSDRKPLSKPDSKTHK